MKIKDVLYDCTKMNEFEFIQKYSKENKLGKILYDLADIICNDKNSSMAREYSTLKECNYSQNESKMDYDGYDLDNNPVEAKPQNYYTNTSSKNPRKLNGSGSFNDYTWERYDKTKEDNPTVLFSGFIDGKLLYILSVKYNDIDNIKTSLEKEFPNRVRKKGHYLRCIKISYNNYKNASSFEIKYIDKEKLKEYNRYISNDLYQRLINE